MSERPLSRRRLSWLAMAAVLLVALGVGWGSAGPRDNEEKAQAIEKTVKCPVCRSQSVETSDAQVSTDMRGFIEREVRKGQSADQIRASLARTYGPDVLLNPPKSGIAGLVWALPVMAFIVAAAGVAYAFSRWRRQLPQEGPTDEDRRLVHQALGGTEGDR